MKYLKSKLGLLVLGHFVNDSYPGFLAPLLPLLILKFNLSLTLAGLLVSVSVMSASFSQPFFGYLSEKSRFKFVILGPLVTAIFMSSIGLMPSYYLLLLVIFLAGLGTGMFHPQAAGMVGYLSEKKKGLALSIFLAGGGMGFALSPIIITSLVTKFGLNKTYLAALPGLILFFLLLKFGSNLTTAIKEKVSELKIKDKLLGHFRPLSLLWSVAVIRELIRMSFAAFLPILMIGKGFTLFGSGVILFVFLFSGVVGGILGGHISDKIGRKNILVFSMFFAFPLFYGFLNTSGLLSFVFLALSGAMIFSPSAPNIALAQELIPDHVSLASSLVMGTAWGISALLVTLVGRIADTIGIISTLNYLIYLLILCFLLALFLPKEHSPTRAVNFKMFN